MKKRKTLLLVFLMISIIVTGTLAYFTIVTDRTALVLVLGEKNEVLITLKPFEIKGTLMSTLDYNSFVTEGLDDQYIQITAENFGSQSKEVYFYYRVNSIDDALVSGATKYAITTSDSQNGTYTEIKTGDFSTVVSGNDLIVYKFTIPAESSIFYRVFTYLDGSQDVSAMSGALLDAEFRAEIRHKIVPDLDEGMIPVTIDNSGSSPVVKTIYADDSEWFNYEEHKWANVVLVKEENRSSYLDTSGITISSEDILAYYVWIPRFEYRYTNLGTSYAGGSKNSPRAIAVNFIPGYRTLPSSNGYKIHPAFTLGNINVSGFWVGKFETTGITSSPTVLPLNESLNGTKISTLFQSSLEFAGGSLNNGSVSFSGNDYYGISSDYDSHMMKNSEWGAVAYLTQSIYGACTSATSCVSIYPNNSGSYTTGKGSGSATLTWNANGSYDWNTTQGVLSSTTQNITGVYDMSGGTHEVMMSVLNYNSNFIYSGNTSSSNSGFAGYIGSILYEESPYVKLPLQKYYDRYTTTSIATACSGKICYGQALSETNGWYNDPNSGFVSSTSPWLVRGGGMGTDTASSTAGIFAISNHSGGNTSGVGFRSVIVSSDGYQNTEFKFATGATMLINKANDDSITNYEDGNMGEMYTFSQASTDQLAATTDYRYIGDSPNNYIDFNGETWRIIGVFDGKIKIIQETGIINIFRDYKVSIGSATSDYGSSDWVDSQLMYMLNPTDIATNVALKTNYSHDDTYVYDANNKIIYQKGCRPNMASGTTYTCNANSWTLSNTALSQVADVTYYLGGNSGASGVSTQDYYSQERGNLKYSDVHSTSWNGKVGLMYPSDYGYTFAYGVSDTCYGVPYDCSSSDAQLSWLFSGQNEYLIMPRYTYDYISYYISSSGYVNGNRYVNTAYLARPVVYLKEDTVLSGSGTSGDHYVIVKDSETVNFDLNAGLPEGYTLLDYIEGYGAQYIDTGYSNSGGFYGDATVSLTALNGAESLLGSHGLSHPYGRNYIGIDDDGTKWNIGTGNVYLASTETITPGNIYNIDYSTLLTGSYLNVDGTQVIVSTDSNSRSTENVLVFACQWSLTHNDILAQMKLYNLKIYNPNNELVRDFVPCMNPSGAVGLYDKVGGNFYANLGTGAFTGERILSEGETTKTVPYGEAYGELPTPEREGYNFLGWYDAATGGNKIESSTIVVKGSNRQTLYARWQKKDNKKYLYDTVAVNAALDNTSSMYVSSSSGINFANIPSDTNGKGVYTVASTRNFEYPIHYYRGAIDNNHVIFGGFCWQIVRTTDTGGVKLIYNGEASADNKCLSTRGSHVGYATAALQTLSSQYYYGSSFTYDSSTSTFKLAGDLVQQTWNSTTGPTLVGKYTCKLNTSDGTCATLYQVVAYRSATQGYALPMSGSVSYGHIGLSKFNSNNNSNNNSLADVGYMFDTRYTHTTKTASSFTSAGVVYGSTVTWDGTKYILNNTTTSENGWATDRTRLAEGYHYTCYTTSGTCGSTVYYIFYFGDSATLYHFTLTNGQTMESIANDMLTNSSSSTFSDMKYQVDSWYAANMTEYTDQLEDIIHCNDRSFAAGDLLDPSSSGLFEPSFGPAGRTIDGSNPSVTCPNASRDGFTVSTSSGGNGLLDYPVGTITADELLMAGANSATGSSNFALSNGQNFWTMSPGGYGSGVNNSGSVIVILNTGQIGQAMIKSNVGVRPTIALANGAEVEQGTGTQSDPYIIK